MKAKTGAKPMIQRLRMSITKHNQIGMAPITLSVPPWEVSNGKETGGNDVAFRGYNPATGWEDEDDMPEML